MKIKSFVTALFGLALAQAKLVMVIRHGEKVDDDHTDLSPKGQARAECLIKAFGKDGNFTTPEKIYAQKPTVQRKSTRPRDTVLPLAKSLGLKVDITYTSANVRKLAQYIMNSPEEVILVSWANDRIPVIAEEFGIENVPEWTKHCFDDVWILSNGETSYFKQENKFKRDLHAYKRNSHKGNIFTLTIEKEGIEDCIDEKLKAQNQPIKSKEYTSQQKSTNANEANKVNLITKVNNVNSTAANETNEINPITKVNNANSTAANETNEVNPITNIKNNTNSTDVKEVEINSSSIQLKISILITIISVLIYALIYHY
ncbi:hypothetical protein H8356DRAFT_1744297 [Neocallimastix lanati (nom. inval.)]|jgi:hypothetical protein|nr:hypothetical protein H8356DRAFT_1744297 [Neocallimastix sp. JGI-2020a]